MSKLDGKQPLLACSISQSHYHSCCSKSTLNQKQTDLEPVSQKGRLTTSQSLPSSCTSAHQWKPPGLYKVYANNRALTLMPSLGNSSLSQTQSWRTWSLVWLDVQQKEADSNYHHSSFFFCRLTVKVRFYSHLHIALLCLFTSFKTLF